MNEYTRGAGSPSDWVTDRVYHAGRVKRYHTWPVHHEQTVGEHSWQVAMIYERIFGRLTEDVERFIRYHDVAELVVGDPPFPVKSSNPGLKQHYDLLEAGALIGLGLEMPVLSREYRAMIKIADLLEMTRFGMLESEMGNRLAVPVIRRTCRAAWKLTNEVVPHHAPAVKNWIRVALQTHTLVMQKGGEHEYTSEMAREYGETN